MQRREKFVRYAARMGTNDRVPAGAGKRRTRADGLSYGRSLNDAPRTAVDGSGEQPGPPFAQR